MKHPKRLPEPILHYGSEFDDRTLATLAGQADDGEKGTNLDCRDTDGMPMALDTLLRRGGSR